MLPIGPEKGLDLAGRELSQITPGPGALVLLRLPADVAEDAIQRAARALSESLQGSQAAAGIVLVGDTDLQMLTDEELASIGLQRIGKPR